MSSFLLFNCPRNYPEDQAGGIHGGYYGKHRYGGNDFSLAAFKFIYHSVIFALCIHHIYISIFKTVLIMAKTEIAAPNPLSIFKAVFMCSSFIRFTNLE